MTLISLNLKSRDSQNVLFGRGHDLDELIKRVKYSGLTAVVGQPKIGKSELLRQLGLALHEAHDYLVGYEESAGETSDLILRSVSNLYARWLIDSSSKQQARILWQQHKKTAIARFGEIFGNVFETVLGITQSGLSALGEGVAKAFSKLASLNQDLKEGGLKFSRLSYDQSRDLIGILGHVTQQPICLILDAWEQSPSIAIEASILSKYLGNLKEWPQTHILLGCRMEESEESWRKIQEVRNKASSEIIYELRSMQLDSDEALKLLTFVRGSVPIAKSVSDQRLLQLIDGYPGVLERWLNPANPKETEEDLVKLANAAHSNKYTELDKQWEELSPSARRIALRLALFRQLKDEREWRDFEELLLSDEREEVIRVLQEEAVILKKQFFPSFGHLTRHIAARECFVNKAGNIAAKAEAEDLIVELASRVEPRDFEARLFSSALEHVYRASNDLHLSPEVDAIYIATASLFPELRDSIKFDPLEKGGMQTILKYPQASPILLAGLIENLNDANHKE